MAAPPQRPAPSETTTPSPAPRVQTVAVLVGTLLVASLAGAQLGETQACLAELDYLLGEWDARVELFRPDGRIARRGRATYAVRPILEGTAIETTSTIIFEGEDPVRGRSTLHAAYESGDYVLMSANSTGSSNFYRGTTEAGGLRVIAELRDERGRKKLLRRTDRLIDAGNFETQVHLSHDDGETWMLHMRQMHRRKLPSDRVTACADGDPGCKRVPSYRIPIGPDRFRLRIPDTPVSSLRREPIFRR